VSPLRSSGPRAGRSHLHLWVSSIVAAGLHLIGYGAFALRLPRSTAKPQAHRTVAISEGQLATAVAHSRQAMQAAQTPKPAAKKTDRAIAPPPEEKLTGQVVALPPSADAKPPKDARYLAENNAHTEHETRSRHASSDFKNVMHEATVTQKAAVTRLQEPQAGAQKVLSDALDKSLTQPGKAAKMAPALEIPKQVRQDRLALTLNQTDGTLRNARAQERIAGNSDRLHIVQQASEGKQAGADAGPKNLTMADLVPQIGQLSRLSGGPTNDGLDDVEEAEGTFLNAREFKYAAFFNRMKQQISQYWRPQAEFQRRDPSGNIYGTQSRLTLVTVTLDAQGSLARLDLAQSCGVDFLDAEALKALRQAAPFTHPPRHLANQAGLIVFSFGFNLDLTGRSAFESPY
jgi:TonB family protein